MDLPGDILIVPQVKFIFPFVFTPPPSFPNTEQTALLELKMIINSQIHSISHCNVFYIKGQILFYTLWNEIYSWKITPG